MCAELNETELNWNGKVDNDDRWKWKDLPTGLIGQRVIERRVFIG